MNQKKSLLSLDTIRSEAMAMRAKIKAIKVSYDYSQKPTEAEKGLRPAKSPPRDQRRTFAMKLPLWSAKLEGLEDGEPIQQRFVVDGKHVAVCRDDCSPRLGRMDNRFAMRGIKEWREYYPVDIRTDDDLHHLSWNFPAVLSLPHFPFHVRENQEKIGERWCHVLEHPPHVHSAIKGIGDGEPVEFVWVDSNNPAIMVKRERAMSHDGNFFPRVRTSFSSFQNVIEGVWLPEHIERQDFTHLQGVTRNLGLGTLIANATCKVKEIKLNEDVTDEDFEFCIEKGEGLSYYSVGPDLPGGSAPIYTILNATDHDRKIVLPLDQPSNEEIKRLIVEKDPGFF